MITLIGLAAFAIVALVGYLIGSISSGYLVGKIYRNVDLRTVGSGSTGATNTFRTLGRGAGILVATFDILKGALAVVFAQLMFGDGNPGRPVADALAAVFAVIGHCWPITLGAAAAAASRPGSARCSSSRRPHGPAPSRRSRSRSR